MAGVCASGFGSCCVFYTTACGGDIAYNTTYIRWNWFLIYPNNQKSFNENYFQDYSSGVLGSLQFTQRPRLAHGSFPKSETMSAILGFSQTMIILQSDTTLVCLWIIFRVFNNFVTLGKPHTRKVIGQYPNYPVFSLKINNLGLPFLGWTLTFSPWQRLQPLAFVHPLIISMLVSVIFPC